MISDKEIEVFLNCSNLLKRGRLHEDSKHVEKFFHENGMIIAKVRASMKQVLHHVEVEVKNGKVVTASCDCAVGLVTCSHMAAVLIHYQRNVSCTDVPCAWVTKKAPKGSDVTDINSLFPRTQSINLEPLDEEMIRQTASNLLTGLQVPPGMSWILSPEVEMVEVSGGFINIERVTNLSVIIFCTDFLSKDINGRKEVLSQFQVSNEEIAEISQYTIGQFTNPMFCELRKCRITASVMGPILLRKQEKPCLSLMKKLAGEYGNLGSVNSIRFGKDRESEALSQFTAKYNVITEPSGMYLHSSGLLGATPDAIGADFIVEIKCLYKYKDLSPEEAIRSYKNFLITLEETESDKNKKFTVNKTHEYYHQIQAQIEFSGKDFAYFVAYTLKGVEKFCIGKDPLWKSVNIPRLLDFYHKYYIPYLLSRHFEE